jgi:acyl-CoA synthetase (AMP-forming)/AMP-acid ligase II
MERLLQYNADHTRLIKHLFQFFQDGQIYGVGVLRNLWAEEYKITTRYVSGEEVFGNSATPQRKRERTLVYQGNDVATIDPLGYMQITDRSKDVIKSGGEWISSIDLENAAVGHPAAAECAVIGLPHPKWDERPLLIVMLQHGASADADSFREFLTGKIAKWWMPDDIVFVDEIPHGPTGKISKLDLRKTFKDHVLSTI